MHRLTIAFVLISVLAPAIVSAAPSSSVAWTVETVRKVRNGDTARGRELALGCASCHGETGTSVSPAYPHLAGQDAAYLYKQLHDYKGGTRNNPLMMAFAAAMSDQDMVDIAAFYAGQPLPPPEGDAGEVMESPLTERGDGPRLIPACSACHGNQGFGNPRSHGMPVLAGQKALYLSETLRAYASGERANDVYSVMRHIAAQLTEQELTNLSTYYAAQGR